VRANGSGAGRSRGGSWRATGAGAGGGSEEPRRLPLSEGRPRLEVRKSQERDAEQPGPVAEPVRLALAPLLSSSSDTHSCWGYFGPTGWTNPGEHVI